MKLINLFLIFSILSITGTAFLDDSEKYSPRELKGIDLYKNNSIQEINNQAWIVSNDYLVKQRINKTTDALDYFCSCEDFTYRHNEVGFCKHIYAVLYMKNTNLLNKLKAKIQ